MLPRQAKEDGEGKVLLKRTVCAASSIKNQSPDRRGEQKRRDKSSSGSKEEDIIVSVAGLARASTDICHYPAL